MTFNIRPVCPTDLTAVAKIEKIFFPAAEAAT